MRGCPAAHRVARWPRSAVSRSRPPARSAARLPCRSPRRAPRARPPCEPPLASPSSRDLGDDLLLVLPTRAQRGALLRQLRQLLLERLEPLLRGPVGLLLQRLALDLQLPDLAL